MARAEDLLFEIRTLRAEISILEVNAEQEIGRVRKRYQNELDPRSKKLHIIEADLVKLMKKEKAEIFAATDQIELVHGFLFYGQGSKLIIPKNAIALIKAQRWPIRISENINRRAIESWPDEWLASIGATREPVETFSYEIRPNGLEGKEE